MKRRLLHRVFKLPYYCCVKLFKLLPAPLPILLSFSSIGDCVIGCCIYMPGSTGILLRRYYYQKKFKQCGKNLIVGIGVKITGAEHISVGDNVHIDDYCIIATGTELIGHITRRPNDAFTSSPGEIVIGSNIHIVQFCVIMGYGGIHIKDNCTLSAQCKIYSLTNTAYDLQDKTKVISLMPYTQAPFLLSPVVLDHNVWLGLNTIVMPGVTIGKDSFCSANAVVMGTFTKNSYISGQPAQRIRDRFLSRDAITSLHTHHTYTQ